MLHSAGLSASSLARAWVAYECSQDAPSLIAVAARKTMVDRHIGSAFDARGSIAQVLIGCFASAWPDATRAN
jgi:hypothetical protein